MADAIEARNRPAPPPRWRAVLAGAVLVLAALFIYAPVVKHGTWLWDDGMEVTQNPEVTGQGGLGAIWLRPAHMDYFPLKTTLQWVAWRLWRDHASAYHLLNVLLHALSGLLVWRLFARLGLRSAWLGGLLFVVHPLAVESVAWIAEFKNTVSLPPLLLAAIAYIDFTETGRRGRQFAALGWFTASLLCKTSGVMLPFVFLLYHFWRSRRVTVANLLATAPFFVVALILGLVTVYFQQTRAIAESVVPIGGLSSRLAIAGLALWFYVGKFLFPLNLVPVYRGWSIDSRGLIDFLPWAFAATVVVACWWRRRTWGRAVLFGAGTFALLLAPVLGLVPMSYMRHSWVADHFVYLPMLGLIGLAVAGIDALLAPVGWRTAGRILVLAVAAVLFLLSRWQGKVFRDERSLWTYTLEHNPNSWAANDGLGRVLQAEGRPDAAAVHFQAAIDAQPRAASPRNNLAQLLIQQGQPAAAVPHLQVVLAIDPKFVAAHSNLGNALFRLGRVDEAMAEFREALRLSPSLVEARNNLASALVMSGQTDEGIRELQRAITDRPDYAEAYDNLGKTLLRTGRAAAALDNFARATALAPQNAGYHYDFGSALIATGRLKEAEAQLQEAVRLNPGFVDAHINLAGVLYQMGNLDGAAAHYEAALRIDPKAGEARQNLEIVRQEQQRRKAGGAPR